MDCLAFLMKYSLFVYGLLSDLFSLFASDLGGCAAREDIEAVLQVLDGEIPSSLRKCFTEVSLSVGPCLYLCEKLLLNQQDASW